MDTVISLIGRNFGILAIDTISPRSIFIMKKDLNKCVEIGKNKYLIVSGLPGDVSQFTDFIQKSVQLNSLKTGIPFSTHSVANFVRKELSECLRKNPVKVNLTILGFDDSIGPSLYFIDYLGNLQRMNYCVQGHASLLVFSLLDRHFKKEMDIKPAIGLLVKCIGVLKNRFLINQVGFLIKIIDSKGCRSVGIL
mmetsp:Transcript_47454/g.111871  ORF Transcript_47454/g.111871 Transcript_47454/m.111871 type:complete len:194 (+) Transcript_47454:30-611(+)